MECIGRKGYKGEVKMKQLRRRCAIILSISLVLTCVVLAYAEEGNPLGNFSISEEKPIENMDAEIAEVQEESTEIEVSGDEESKDEEALTDEDSEELNEEIDEEDASDEKTVNEEVADEEEIFEEIQIEEDAVESDLEETEYMESKVVFIDIDKMILPRPVKEGKIFIEWNTEEDGSGQGYKAGDIVDPSNIILYSIWEDESEPDDDAEDTKDAEAVESIEEPKTIIEDDLPDNEAAGTEIEEASQNEIEQDEEGAE